MEKEKTRTQLSDPFLRKRTPPASGFKSYTDTLAKGLTYRLYATGRGRWYVRYTDPRTKSQKPHLLGDYPAMSLADARAAATHFRSDLLKGRGPNTNQIETIKDLIDDYHTRHSIPNTRKPKQTRALYDQHVIPYIGKLRLDDFRRGDAIGLLDKLSDKGLGAQVNRVHAALHGALDWGVNAGRIDLNPMAGLKRRVKEQPRDRVLTDTELRAVWEAAAARSTPSREFVQLLILSMQRRDECRAMRWDELDETTGLWTIPANRTKASRAHIVPLSRFAWDILETLPRLGPNVFTLDGERPYAGHSKIVDALSTESGVTGWTLHDLRRTGRTGLSRLGVPVLIAELILNHARNDLERVYDRHAFTEEKRDALERWGEHVRRVVLNSEAGARVVSLR